ncbi:MAG TPA: FtsX-like permease family protein [Gemmatimonadales bacterium]|nr:FtsX-like permease family protein [Gemmatimonadales bacterium]
MRLPLALLALTAAARGPLAAQVAEVAVPTATAEALGLRVGDTVRIGAAPDSLRRLAVVSAIYEPRPDPAEITRRAYGLRLHLPDLAALLGAPDRVDRFGVALRRGVTADSAAALLNAGAFGFRAYPSDSIASGSSQTFLVVSRFHRAIAVITIVASAVFLLCIMLLKVEERRMDAAVMRFVGVRRRTIFGALLLEAAVLAVAGAVLGAGIAYVASAITNAYYQRFFRTDLVFSLITVRILLFGVSLSLLLGLVAGAAAAWRLVRTRPMVLWGRA